MLSKEGILRYLNSDKWFTPNKSTTRVEIADNDGNIIKVAQSYYHHFDNDSGHIEIRVSDHGTYLNTWIKRKRDPSISLQNLSVVFSNEPITSNLTTEPIYTIDNNGNEVKTYVYFVVEQYVYRLDNLDVKDFKKVISQIKNLGKDGVFNDPLRKKPSKRANRKVLTPNDQTDQPIPPSNNQVNPRQSVVTANKDNEVDKDGNVIKDSKKRRGIIEQRNNQPRIIRLTESEFKQMLLECVTKIINEIA